MHTEYSPIMMGPLTKNKGEGLGKGLEHFLGKRNHKRVRNHQTILGKCDLAQDTSAARGPPRAVDF